MAHHTRAYILYITGERLQRFDSMSWSYPGEYIRAAARSAAPSANSHFSGVLQITTRNDKVHLVPIDSQIHVTPTNCPLSWGFMGVAVPRVHSRVGKARACSEWFVRRIVALTK